VQYFEGAGYSTSGTAVMGGSLPCPVDLAEISGKRVHDVDRKITARLAQDHQHWFDATGTSVSVIEGTTSTALDVYRRDWNIQTIAPVRFIWPAAGHPGFEDWRRPKATILQAMTTLMGASSHLPVIDQPPLKSSLTAHSLCIAEVRAATTHECATASRLHRGPGPMVALSAIASLNGQSPTAILSPRRTRLMFGCLRPAGLLTGRR
jgi:hypothetical protein